MLLRRLDERRFSRYLISSLVFFSPNVMLVIGSFADVPKISTMK